jgi:hypothetical protein
MLNQFLHSYGFQTDYSPWWALLILSHLVLIVVGCVPRQYWKSFEGQAEDE